jgi:hypothetical protein
MGREVVLGLDDNYLVGLQMSYLLQEHIPSQVVRRCSEIRAGKQPNAGF